MDIQSNISNNIKKYRKELGLSQEALAGEVEEKLNEIGLAPHHMEGYNEGIWTVVDYCSVIVHVFGREAREFYKLEKLWSDAEDIDISELLV